jgi:hypothetical protein
VKIENKGEISMRKQANYVHAQHNQQGLGGFSCLPIKAKKCHSGGNLLFDQDIFTGF